MTNTVASVRRKIAGANDLQSVVRTMKALAGASIGQYERSLVAVGHYARVVEQGLSLCFRDSGPVARQPEAGAADRIGAVVFGSDQGLVGAFNEAVAERAVSVLAGRPGKSQIWAVGGRVHERLAEADLPPIGVFTVPLSVAAIAPLVGRLLVEYEARNGQRAMSEFHLIYNRPTKEGLYEPATLKLLPLDEAWRRSLAGRPWPAGNLPEIVGNSAQTLGTFIREYLFVSLFRACAESLASENMARLAAMERADRNIDELLVGFNSDFRQLRQTAIDAELSDIIAGYEAPST
jgi:F-type H+-transporting ATPase subunit gamma